MNSTQVKKILSSASKNLGNQKHFERIFPIFPQQDHFCEN